MRFGKYIYIHAPSSSRSYLRADGVILSGLGAVLMDGGVETSASYLQTFIIALLQSPESQLRAQEEIDSVVGGDRLPVLDDFKRLPYVKALVTEVS
jgi:cytochrome P450